MDRLAAGQLIPAAVSTILKDTGLLTEDRFDARVLPGYGIDLTPEQRETFSRACRLGPGELDAMLMRSLDGVAYDLIGLDVRDANSVRAVAHREWSGFAGSACCPECLRETGGWRLRWRLWTSFVCLTHGRLLGARCPRCEHRTGNYRADQGNRPRFLTHVPVPGLCANSLPRGLSAQGRAAEPCGFDLRTLETADLSGAPRLLAAQRAVNAALERGEAVVAGQEVSALVYVRHLRSLVALALHAAQPGDLGELPAPIHRAWQEACEARDDLRASEAGRRGTRFHPYKAAPDDPALVAATLPWAVELLASPDQAGVTRGLRPLIERSRGIRGSAVRALGRDFHLEGVLAAALDEALAPRALTQRTVGHLAPGGTGEYRTFDPARVPHLIWAADYENDFGPLLRDSGLSEQAARVAISMALVRLARPCSVRESAALLGLEGRFGGTSTNPMMLYLGRTAGKEAFSEALHALATRLEGPGPHRDYRAAERALEDFVELDADAWEACRNAAGLPSAKSAALRRNSAAWIWSEILSSHPHFSPALTAPGLNRVSAREVYRRFEASQLPALEEALSVQRRWMEGELGLS
ncbi:TniQ family protein [Deinococcus sp. NW-56]|uniref:TniQ family protein n=1 Tax=Deinococcus sp. NW-56 TaxID=2080419 RepID=UPI00131A0664|nr:TniQ family protein [Deinococcus sp. NW-56]